MNLSDLSNPVSFKPGDRVRVVRPIVSFGDYAIGDFAEVMVVDDAGDMYVRWEQGSSDPNVRCTILFPAEVELVA